MTRTALLVRLYAVLLAAAGVALLFAPEVLAGGAEGALASALAQLVGGALLAFAVANWTARDALLGGIYGRPHVAGNQAFAFIGVLVLAKGLGPDAPLAVWALAAVLSVGAVVYSVLLFRGPLSDSLPPLRP